MIIRPTRPDEYRATEFLTREAFWNVYRPGCEEHLILHNFRNDPAFVPELDCVLEQDGRIAAHIMYCRAYIDLPSGSHMSVLMFGPVCVEPTLQRRGLGSALIIGTLDMARKLGNGAVIITGSPDYYHRFGFESCSRHGIFYEGAPRDDAADYFMVNELIPGYLPTGGGTFNDPACYSVDADELARFDAQFPPRVKERRPGQLV